MTSIWFDIIIITIIASWLVVEVWISLRINHLLRRINEKLLEEGAKLDILVSEVLNQDAERKARTLKRLAKRLSSRRA